MSRFISHSFLAGTVAVFALPSLAAGEILVEGRRVETKADGACIGFLAPGDQRYLDCLNGTVYDAATGLVWLQQAHCPALGSAGTSNWSGAMAAAASVADGLDCDGDGTVDLTDGSQPGDWRLPTDSEWDLAVREALALGCIDGDQGPPTWTRDSGTQCHQFGPSAFDAVLDVLYWSSTTRDAQPSTAWARSLETGNQFFVPKSVSDGVVRIWPVRATTPRDGDFFVAVEGSPVETAAAGPCYDEMGLGQERYVDCGNGTVLDLLTDLLWLRDATCTALGSGVTDWIDAMGSVAELGDGTCGLSDGSQPGDWRLPLPAEWALTTERAAELGCTLPGSGDPPALTDTAGTGCLAAGSTPFVGIADSSSLDFWTTVAADTLPDKAVGFRLKFADAFSLPLKTTPTGWWIWPVRPRVRR